MAVAVVVSLGCGSKDEIRRYQAPKITSASNDQQTADSQRMLAAIATDGDLAWFFKLMGPSEAVAKQRDNFRELLKSLKFAGGKPKWTAPEGWREKAGSGMRFATLSMTEGDEELELTVISLPKPDGDDQEYTLANVNRWRGQLQLGPLSLDELQGESEEIKYEDGTAVFVDLEGKSSGGGMGRPPFAAMGGGSGSEPDKPAKLKLKFDPPAGWKEGELVVSRSGITLKHEAAFEVSDGDEKVEITIDRMPAMGGTLANVNRWRAQVGLSPVDEAGYRESVQKIELASKDRDYVQLIGPEQTILGVIAEHDGAALYIKLKGDKDLAQTESERFEAFVKSIRLD